MLLCDGGHDVSLGVQRGIPATSRGSVPIAPARTGGLSGCFSHAGRVHPSNAAGGEAKDLSLPGSPMQGWPGMWDLDCFHQQAPQLPY